MFQQLLESNAVHRPRVGGSLLSTAAHAALVATAIALTTQVNEPPVAMPDPTARFIAVAPPPPDRPAAAHLDAGEAGPGTRAAVPDVPVLPSVLEISIGIATPDLSSPVMRATDFGSRGHPAGGGEGGLFGAVPGGGEGGAWLADAVDKPVIMKPGVVTPSYPALLRSAGLAGAVLVEFVVDTLGRVEAGSLRVLHADHELFAASVRDAAPRLRFIPAEARGRKVRQLVRLPFRFDLNS